MNKVVARYADGRMVKGVTADFFPGKDLFHVSVSSALGDEEPVEIHTKDLKALFFVKDYVGDSKHDERNEFDPSGRPAGRPIRVAFKDGEVLLGTTTGYQRGRPGFFILPADTASNIERCYVVTAATKDISFI